MMRPDGDHEMDDGQSGGADTPCQAIRFEADTPGLVLLKCAFAGPPIGGAILSVAAVVGSLGAAMVYHDPRLLLGLLAPLILVPGSYVFGIVPALVAGCVMAGVTRLTRDGAWFLLASLPAAVLGGLAGDFTIAGATPWQGGGEWMFLPLLSVASGLVCAFRVIRLEPTTTPEGTGLERSGQPSTRD